jgi:hypothetical protein
VADDCEWIVRRRPDNYTGAVVSDVAEHGCPPGWHADEWHRVGIVDDREEGLTWAGDDRPTHLVAIAYWPDLPLTLARRPFKLSAALACNRSRCPPWD